LPLTNFDIFGGLVTSNKDQLLVVTRIMMQSQELF